MGTRRGPAGVRETVDCAAVVFDQSTAVKLIECEDVAGCTVGFIFAEWLERAGPYSDTGIGPVHE